MPAMASLTLVRMCFVLSTIYTIFILILFIVKKDFIIPLTFRTPTYRWGELQQLMRDNPLSLPQNKLDALFVSWCPRGLNPLFQTPASPQCSCINNFQFTFMNNSAEFINGNGPKDLAALGELQADGVVKACLGKRTTWRKDTCAHFCQMHLAVPVLVASLCMSLFFSRITEFNSKFWDIVSSYLPVLLALLVIIMNLVADALGAVPAVLTVLSAILEMTFACSCVEAARVYWSFQRFFMGSIAVWAAVTHQGRDLYVLSAYAALGFFIGMLAYTEYIMRFKQGCNKRMRVVSIYVWVGICVITASFLLLIQQHWYPDSPTWSSTASVTCLIFTCLQCVVMVPGLWISDTVQTATGLALLSISVLAVGVDILGADF
jgi:hypothetical protein